MNELKDTSHNAQTTGAMEMIADADIGWYTILPVYDNFNP